MTGDSDTTYGKTFTARRGGDVCVDCHGPIEAGAQMRYAYRRSVKFAAHGSAAACEAVKAARQVAEVAAPISLSRGEGYGGTPYVVGQTLRLGEARHAQGYPEYVTVVSASQQYVREDGMSFGVGDEDGHIYSARCREATPDEVAKFQAVTAERDARREAAREVEQLAAEIQTVGERPRSEDGSGIVPEGEVLLERDRAQRIYGGGTWFVLGAEWVWYVQNNGSDGDDWSPNNVRTGGAGAIGWRVPATDDLAARLRRLAEMA